MEHQQHGPKLNVEKISSKAVRLLFDDNCLRNMHAELVTCNLGYAFESKYIAHC